jgi:hypothetical protein
MSGLRARDAKILPPICKLVWLFDVVRKGKINLVELPANKSQGCMFSYAKIKVCPTEASLASVSTCSCWLENPINREFESVPGVWVVVCGSRDNLSSVAHKLYDSLRTFDRLNVDVIFSEIFSDCSIGGAIMNRLRKAAGYNVVRESPVDEVQTNGDFP